MKALSWLLLLGVVAAAAYTLVLWRRRWQARQQAAEERMASFIAQARPAEATKPPASLVLQERVAPQERLLLDAAAKAGEAGEPALSIQLYARLLSRYPQTSFAAQARAAVDEQKRRLTPG